MKILVFSDSHLTDRFEEKKFNYLKKIISETDRVIINGDFWDGQLITFDKFINSDWKKLFPLLKSKKTVYLYGNHDLKSLSDNRTNLFSTAQDHQYKLKINGKTLIIEHGNRILPLIDETLIPFWMTKYTTIVAGFLLTHIPQLQFILKKTGQALKKGVKDRVKKNEIYICGHSHWPDFDLKNQYINTGYVELGEANYLWIKDGKLIPISERYD